MTDAVDPVLYVAQTGLKGEDLPTHRSVFTTSNTQYSMQDGDDTLEVRLSAAADNGVSVDKVYTFHRNKYAIDVNV